MRLFDIKTNIMPRVDPNCDSISESLKLLNKFRNRNISKICTVPNYFDLGDNNNAPTLCAIIENFSKSMVLE